MVRRAFAACLLAGTLVATAAAGKPTLVGPAPGGAKSACTSCMGECLSTRAKCVPSCGAGLKGATDPQKRCVATCFSRQAVCQQECKKKSCKDEAGR